MNLLLFLLKKSKKLVFMAIFFGLLTGASSARIITLIHQAIGSTNEENANIGLLFAITALFYLVVILCSRIPLYYLSESTVFELRMKMIKQILSSRLRYLETVGRHRLYATLTGDINSISQGLMILPAIVINISAIVGCVIYLATLSWKVFLSLLVILTLLIGIVRVAMGRATRLFGVARDIGDTLFGYFKDVTEGTKELKMHSNRREALIDQDLRTTAYAYRDKRISAFIGMDVADALSQLSYYLLMGFAIFLLPQFQEVDTKVSSGVILLLLFLLNPITGLMNLASQISPALVALRKVNSLGLNLTENEAGEQLNLELPKTFQKLEVSNVLHTYYNERKDEQFTLGPVSMSLSPGEVVFLVGGNGSGKSTLAKAVTGLYEPEGGTITMNGQLVDDSNREWYRQHFSTVFGDFYLFDRLLGMESTNLEEKVKGYLKQLHLEHKVSVIDGELSTTQLSTGQRKRLALLVSYLEERPIYMFDEWASDQDPQFKDIFYTQLIPELKSMGKTVFAITHDDRYFNHADRVLKLEDGKLVNYYEK